MCVQPDGYLSAVTIHADIALSSIHRVLLLARITAGNTGTVAQDRSSQPLCSTSSVGGRRKGIHIPGACAWMALPAGTLFKLPSSLPPNGQPACQPATSDGSSHSSAHRLASCVLLHELLCSQADPPYGWLATACCHHRLSHSGTTQYRRSILQCYQRPVASWRGAWLHCDDTFGLFQPYRTHCTCRDIAHCRADGTIFNNCHSRSHVLAHSRQASVAR